MSKETNASQTGQVKAAGIKQFRIIRPNERPNDALFEIMTASGEKQYFLMPQSALKELARKLTAFIDNQSDSGSAN